MSARMPFPDSAAHDARSARSLEQTGSGKRPRLRRIVVFNAAAICGYALIPALNDWLNSYRDDDLALVLPFTLDMTRELLDALNVVCWPLMVVTVASLLVVLLTVSLNRYADGAPFVLKQFARLCGGLTMLAAFVTLGSLAVAGSLMLLSFVAVLLTVLIVLLIIALGWGSIFLMRVLFGF